MTVARCVPSWVNTCPTLTPRELISPWQVEACTCQSSTAGRRWNQMAWSGLAKKNCCSGGGDRVPVGHQRHDGLGGEVVGDVGQRAGVQRRVVADRLGQPCPRPDLAPQPRRHPPLDVSLQLLSGS